MSSMQTIKKGKLTPIAAAPTALRTGPELTAQGLVDLVQGIARADVQAVPEVRSKVRVMLDAFRNMAFSDASKVVKEAQKRTYPKALPKSLTGTADLWKPDATLYARLSDCMPILGAVKWVEGYEPNDSIAWHTLVKEARQALKAAKKTVTGGKVLDADGKAAAAKERFGRRVSKAAGNLYGMTPTAIAEHLDLVGQSLKELDANDAGYPMVKRVFNHLEAFKLADKLAVIVTADDNRLDPIHDLTGQLMVAYRTWADAAIPLVLEEIVVASAPFDLVVEEQNAA